MSNGRMRGPLYFIPGLGTRPGCQRSRDTASSGRQCHSCFALPSIYCIVASSSFNLAMTGPYSAGGAFFRNSSKQARAFTLSPLIL